MFFAGSGDNAGHVVKLRGLPFSTTAEEVVEFLSNVNICNGIEGLLLLFNLGNILQDNNNPNISIRSMMHSVEKIQ